MNSLFLLLLFFFFLVLAIDEQHLHPSDDSSHTPEMKQKNENPNNQNVNWGKSARPESKLKVDPELDSKAESQIGKNEELLKKFRDNLGKIVARSSKGEYPLKEWYQAKHDSWKILESYGLKQNYNDKLIQQLFKIDKVVDQYEKEVIAKRGKPVKKKKK